MLLFLRPVLLITISLICERKQQTEAFWWPIEQTNKQTNKQNSKQNAALIISPTTTRAECRIYRPLLRGATLSLRRIKSFVFARLTSPRREFSARLAVQKQSFLFFWDSTWPPSDKGLFLSESATLVVVTWVDDRVIEGSICFLRYLHLMEVICLR